MALKAIRYIPLLLLLLPGITVPAQTPFSVRILDARNAAAVSYAECVIRSDRGNTEFKLANEDGVLILPELEGTYTIAVHSVGYTSAEAHVSCRASGTCDPATIHMQQEDELLNDVVITSQYTGRSARSAVEKVEIIDLKMLEARSIFNLREAVMHRMNVQVRQDNSTGSAMSLMGISGQNVKIMIDGVPVIGRLDGNIDLSQINLNDVERIEIIEGPVSTNYGTNALAGVINVITKKSGEKGINVSADAYYESAGYYNAGVHGNAGVGKSHIRLGVGRNFFAGWSPDEGGRWQLWKPKEQYWGRAVINRKIKGFDVFLRSEYFNEFLLNRGRPLTPYFETAFDEHFSTTRADQQLQFRKTVAKGRQIDGFIAYNFYVRHRNTFFRDLVELQSDPISSPGSNDTTRFVAYRSRTTYSFSSPGKKLNYQLGYDAVHDVAKGLRIADGGQSMTDLALFGSAEYRLTSRLLLKPGMRVSWNSAYQAPIIPMLSARLGKENYVYRASWSRGFRAPDLKELHIFFVDVNHNVQGNPYLKAESSNHFLLSADGMHSVRNGFLKPSISAFYNDINNKINLANISSDSYTYINIDQFKSSGGRLNLEWMQERTRISGGLGLTAVSNGLNFNRGDFYRYWEGSAALSHRFVKARFTLSTKFNGKQQVYIIDAESQEVSLRETRSYTLLDMQCSRDFLRDRLQLSAGIKNLMNVGNIQSVTSVGGAHGSESVALPIGTGRSYFIRINYVFQKDSKDA